MTQFNSKCLKRSKKQAYVYFYASYCSKLHQIHDLDIIEFIFRIPDKNNLFATLGHVLTYLIFHANNSACKLVSVWSSVQVIMLKLNLLNQKEIALQPEDYSKSIDFSQQIFGENSSISPGNSAKNKVFFWKG